MITVRELVEQLSKYRGDAIVTVRVGDEDYPVESHKVYGCFSAEDGNWQDARVDFWICSLGIDSSEYIEHKIYGK